MDDERLCVLCGGPLPTGNPLRRFCSAYCRREHSRQKDLARVARKHADWVRRNPGRAQELARATYLRTQVQRRIDALAWAMENPVKVAAARARRRAVEASAPREWSAADWESLLRQYDYRCAYCGAAGDLVVDHRVALSRGGSNTIENIVPACRTCNARKGVKDELDFRALLAYEEFVRGRLRRIEEELALYVTASRE